MTLDHARLPVAAGWMLAVTAVGFASGVTGTVPVLWVAAGALIPASLTLLWHPPARAVARVVHDADLAP